MAERRDAMFRGDKINITEQRAVLHVALRAPTGCAHLVDGARRRAGRAQGARRDGGFRRRACAPARWLGHTGKRIRNVVNIGIGGSYLGPEMAYRALRPFSDRSMTFRFVSNVDGADFTEATHDLDAAETLFIVSSKTFTTLETMTNAATARKWLVGKLGSDAAVAKHFVARVDQHRGGDASSASTPPTCSASGTGSAAVIRWISAIGLSTMIAIGARRFPRHAGRLPRDGRAFPHRAAGAQPAAAAGPADRLVQQLLRRADASAMMPYSSHMRAVSRLSAAVADGEQRQAR